MPKEKYKVYFIRAGKNKQSPVKIGVTKDIELRLRHLQTGNPHRLKVVSLIECSSKEDAYKLELRLHKALRKQRLCGEWFRCHAEGWNLNTILSSFESDNETSINKVKYLDKDAQIKSLKKEVKALEEQIEEFLDQQIISKYL